MKPSKKAKKRLEARLKDWAATVANFKGKNVEGYHKPGSNKK